MGAQATSGKPQALATSETMSVVICSSDLDVCVCGDIGLDAQRHVRLSGK